MMGERSAGSAAGVGDGAAGHSVVAPERGGPLVLAIESSCDETAAAVLDGTRSLLGHVVHSQVELHARFGGVVPELASRSHVMAIGGVVDGALERAGARLDDIAGVVVTAGPGLVGSLLVGLEYARGLAWARDLPMEPVNHLEGHLLAPWLGVADGFAEPGWPFIGLVVSGGHTSLYHCTAPGVYEELGRTLDDAAGEAYDKVSKLLGLGYPGGGVIDRLARSGDPAAIAFPRPMEKKGGYHFSFSGIKTAVSYHVADAGHPEGQALHDLAASFQEAVADVLVMKAVRAARRLGVPRIVVSGGVACNSRLRSLMRERAEARGIEVVVPPPVLCTDNAAMIGAAGYARVHRRIVAGEGFRGAAVQPRATWPVARPAARGV